MASDFFMFDNTSSFYSDPFSPFTDSTSIDSSHHDILQSFQACINGSTIQENGVLNNDNNNNFLDQVSCGILSSSPPSQQFENLSLTQIPTPQNYISPTNPLDVSGLDGVKLEEFEINFASENGDFNSSFCGSVDDRAMRVMQRSYSSNLVDEKQRNFCFQPRFDCVLEPPSNLQPQVLCISPERNFSYQIRRVSSTGDLQRMRTTETRNVISSSPLSTQGSFLEETNFKVGRYTAEERKERIHRYRAKRNQRNFNKTIKYACRKTLADNRPRIRGRFASNDEAVDIPKTAAMFNRYEEDDDLWVNRYHDEEEEDGPMGRGPLCNSYGSAGTLYQYYSYR